MGKPTYRAKGGCRRSVVGALLQADAKKVAEVVRPAGGVRECRRRVVENQGGCLSADTQHSAKRSKGKHTAYAHGVHARVRWLSDCHLDSGDGQGPNVGLTGASGWHPHRPHSHTARGLTLVSQPELCRASGADQYGTPRMVLLSDCRASALRTAKSQLHVTEGPRWLVLLQRPARRGVAPSLQSPSSLHKMVED